MYTFLLFLHIVSAIVWVGGAVSVQLLASRVGRSTDTSELPRMARHFEFLGTAAFLPASVLLLVTGLVMTIQAWSFQLAWILIALTLWLLSATAGAFYLGPRAKRAARLFEDEGPGSPAARALISRMFVVSRVELLSFVVIIALMVFKPGI